MVFIIKQVIPEEYSYISTNINNSSWAIFDESLLTTFEEQIMINTNGIAVFRVRPVCIGNQKDCYVCVKEFTANNEHIIIPTTLFNTLDCEPTTNVIIEYVTPPKATNIKLRPVYETFYQIEDIKSILEMTIQQNYPVIREGQYIYLNYLDEVIPIEITHLEPSNLCTTIDTDVEVDFESIETKSDIREIPVYDTDSEMVDVDLPKKKSIFSTIKKVKEVKEETKVIKSESSTTETIPVSVEEVRTKRLARFNVKQ